jgi:carbonic anhydrase
MLLKALILASAFVPAILACPQHNNSKRSKLRGRQENPTEPGSNSTQNDWAYEASFNWGRVNPEYSLCGTKLQCSVCDFSEYMLQDIR